METMTRLQNLAEHSAFVCLVNRLFTSSCRLLGKLSLGIIGRDEVCGVMHCMSSWRSMLRGTKEQCLPVVVENG